MTVRQPRLSKEEHARLGIAIYEQQVRPQVEAGNQGKIVAIDVETGAFEVAEDTLTASERLLTRCPDAQIWCVRIGHRGVHRFADSTRLWRATDDYRSRQRQPGSDNSSCSYRSQRATTGNRGDHRHRLHRLFDVAACACHGTETALAVSPTRHSC